ncbi:MAG: hypothetical protein K2I64_01620 [Muribaculaceae bacterium]|nr:hypothetical protein [Muribaculaceae bacterium]
MTQDKDNKTAQWKGYTLEEMSQRRAINAIKQEMTVEQLSTVYTQLASGKISSDGSSSASPDLIARLNSRLSKVISFATYGARALKIARQVKDVVNQFRSK